MTLNRELKTFEKSCAHLSDRVHSLANVDEPSVDHEFLAEAIVFRLFRNQERLIRALFLEACKKTRSLAGKRIKSKLRSNDWETAEEILKSNNKFLDWGNPTSIKNLANLIFENGYPVAELIAIKQSKLVDLQKFRNFIAHDSKEALKGYNKSARNYLRTGDAIPESVGMLMMYRKRPTDQLTIKTLFQEVNELSAIIRTL